MRIYLLFIVVCLSTAFVCAQTTQPVVVLPTSQPTVIAPADSTSVLSWLTTTSPERLAIILAAWFVTMTAIIGGGFKLAKYMIAEYFDTKKLIRQQQQLAQATGQLIDVNDKNTPRQAVDPALKSAVFSIGTGDGTNK